MNVGIVTARGGSTRLPGKHLRLVGGRALIEYPLRALLGSRLVTATWLVTDSEPLAEIARRMGARVLVPPPELTSDSAAQAHALTWAVSRLIHGHSEIDNVAALLGNTVMVEPADVDAALDLLQRRRDADSVITVWEAEDDHPARALRLDGDGYLVPAVPGGPSVSNVQGYTRCYYQDQGVWAFRAGTIWRGDGPPPWTWVGRRCLPLVRPWFVGRDVDVEDDLEIHEWWVGRKGAARD